MKGSTQRNKTKQERKPETEKKMCVQFDYHPS